MSLKLVKGHKKTTRTRDKIEALIHEELLKKNRTELMADVVALTAQNDRLLKLVRSYQTDRRILIGVGFFLAACILGLY